MGLSTRRAPLVLLALVIGATSVLAARATWREGLQATRWRLKQLWSWRAQEDLSSRVCAGRDARADAFVVVRGTRTLAVLDARGKRRAHGAVDWGARLAIGDADGQPGDEIAVATFDDRPTLQLYDANLRAVGPSVTLNDLRRAAGLALLDLEGDGRSEFVVGDFSGCIAALSYPTYLWDHCIDGSKASQDERQSGDPFALRDLVLMRARGQRHLLSARASGELLDLHPDGQRRWHSPARFENLLGLWALDFDGRGDERLLMVSRDAGWRVLDELGAELASGQPASYLAAAAPIEWDGDARTREVALAHDYGHLSVIDPAPRLQHAAAASAQILALAGADADGDGRDELLAGTSTGRLELLVRRGAGFERLAEDAFEGELYAVLAWPAAPETGVTRVAAAAPHFVVAAGQALAAYRAENMPGPALYNPLVAGSLTLLLLALTFGILRLGGPGLAAMTVALPTTAELGRGASERE
jgi:hypothetical protein